MLDATQAQAKPGLMETILRPVFLTVAAGIASLFFVTASIMTADFLGPDATDLERQEIVEQAFKANSKRF